MRSLLALALLAAVASAAAQTGMPDEMRDDDYWARIGEGDIPTTNVTEGAGWNVAEYLRFDAQGGQQRIPLASDAGTVTDVSCTCGNATIDGMDIVVDGDAGQHVVRLVRAFPAASAFLVDFALYGGQEGTLIAYVPQGMHVDTSAQRVEDPLNCTSAPCAIHQYATGGGLHFAILPGSAPAGAPGEDDDGLADDLLPIVLGALGGVLLWAFLVQRGYVQRRRRQAVTTAVHKQVAATESKEMLQARKRVLMAGLKDLEMAKMNKQVDDAAYDKLKAELKRETVAVMRALEESG